MPAWHPGPFCIYHISASVLWRAFCCGGCPCSVLPHLCLSQHAPLTCLAVTIDLINILLRSTTPITSMVTARIRHMNCTE